MLLIIIATVYVHAITMKNGNEFDKQAINLEQKNSEFNFYLNLFHLLFAFKYLIQNHNLEFERKNFRDKIHKKGCKKGT